MRTFPPWRSVGIVVLAMGMALARPTASFAADAESVPTIGGIAGGSAGLALVLALFQDRMAPAACRVCASNSVDESVRDALRWENPRVAKGISDGLLVAIPTGAVVGSFVHGAMTDRHRGLVDGLLVLESISITALGAQIAKVLVARQRPYALHGTGTYPLDTDSRLSFFSGHTSLTMAAGTSLAIIERQRGGTAWPYLLAGAVALSLTTGYLRIGADKHWFTDVVSGAVWGAAVGIAVPLIHLRRQDGGEKGNGVTLLATPFVLTGTF